VEEQINLAKVLLSKGNSANTRLSLDGCENQLPSIGNFADDKCHKEAKCKQSFFLKAF